jgi:hypothetical protein
MKAKSRVGLLNASTCPVPADPSLSETILRLSESFRDHVSDKILLCTNQRQSMVSLPASGVSEAWISESINQTAPREGPADQCASTSGDSFSLYIAIMDPMFASDMVLSHGTFHR